MQLLEEARAVDIDADDFEISNAVQKVLLIVYHVQDQLMIDEVTGEDPPAAGGGSGGSIAVGCGSISQEQHQALLFQLHSACP